MAIESPLPAELRHVDPPSEASFYIPATQTVTRPRRTLKCGDTFIVTDSHGDIGASTGDPDGLFHADTRFLSRLELLLNGEHPLLLGSNVRDDNTLLAVDLTNPDFYDDGQIILQKDLVHIARTIFLWRGTAYQRLALRNHGDHPIALRPLAAFRQRFRRPVRGARIQRARRGTASRKVVAPDQVLLSYHGPRWRAAAHAADLRSGAHQACCHGCVLPHRARAARGQADLPGGRLQRAGRGAPGAVPARIARGAPRASRRHARA